LKGLGNVTKDPTFFRVSILIQAGTLVFLNPAGNSSEANGVPFGNVLVALTAVDPISAPEVTKNGSTLSEVPFHDAEMIDAVVAALQAQCDAGDPTSCDNLKEINQKPNWFRLIVVTQLQVLGEQFTNNDRVDALGSQCVAPFPAEDALNFVGVNFDYGCTEECHNKDGDICPLSLPLD
jgi:hypothetical protein